MGRQMFATFTPSFGVSAFVIDDLVAIIRLAKACIGSFFGTTLLGYGVLHFIAVCATVAAFITGAVAVVLRCHAFVVDYIYVSTGSLSQGDLFEFIGYVLNFDFLVAFFSFYYFIFCTITIVFISLLIADFCSHVYPYVAQFIRSSINWISGDS